MDFIPAFKFILGLWLFGISFALLRGVIVDLSNNPSISPYSTVYTAAAITIFLWLPAIVLITSAIKFWYEQSKQTGG